MLMIPTFSSVLRLEPHFRRHLKSIKGGFKMRWKSSSYILFLILFAAVLVVTSHAQQLPKIGVINSQRVLETSMEGKRVITQLQEKDNKVQGELGKYDEDIRKLESKMNTQRLTLSEQSLLDLRSDIERKRTERKRRAEDSLRELQELQLRLFNKVKSELLPIIEQLGKEKGFDIIFDLANSGALYFSPVIDITDEVIKRYNASKAAK
jgi:outer membrane protein